MSLIAGVDQYGVTHPRLDASLLNTLFVILVSGRLDFIGPREGRCMGRPPPPIKMVTPYAIRLSLIGHDRPDGALGDGSGAARQRTPIHQPGGVRERAC